MKAPKPPEAPDPKETGGAQTATNIGTAIAQAELNNINQVTPEGTLTTERTGFFDYKDPLTKKTHKIPQYTQTTQYSPEQQALYDQGLEFDKMFNQIGLDQTSKIGNLLGKPLDLNNQTTEDAIYDRYSRRLDDRFGDADRALQSQLSDKGIKVGSTAYTGALQDLGEQKTDAYNQIAIDARNQAVNEASLQRSIPINEIIALMNGQQLNPLQFPGTNQTGIAGVDYAGLVNQKYQGDLNAYNQQVASRNGMLGGLFGIGSSLLGGLFSDERAKMDIKHVATMANGLKIYTFKYRPEMGLGNETHMGLMAQEVEKVIPEAVGERYGTKTVDYGVIARAA